ncbi:MAG TPA: class I SAM-dependent methyltransferase [Candidatus Hydrogenedentes bacterium]|nr:class I SAM-dependent methyltransferase [Candidatus Hydrogenedentota bacterium]
MSLKFRMRDWANPPRKILMNAGVKSGITVLDFGCGPGGFTLAAAKLAGPEGRVLAFDIHPLAVKFVEKGAARRGLGNVQTFLKSSVADVPEESVDMVLLYDILHHLKPPEATLAELRRVLKPAGVLSVSDHHWTEAQLMQTVTAGSLFRPAGRSRWTFQFERTKEGQTS